MIPGKFEVISESNSDGVPENAQPVCDQRTTDEIDEILSRVYRIHNRDLAEWIAVDFRMAYQKGFIMGARES